MSVEIDGKRYSWSTTICVADWNQQHPDRPAAPQTGSERFVSGDVDRCAWCGGGTTSGIYVRADPRTVPFPSLDVDDEPYSDLVVPISRALAAELAAT